MSLPSAVKAAVRPTWGITATDINAILKLLAANPVIGVVAPTGSGKSTTLIESFTQVAPCTFVAEPTVPACDSLRKRMGTLIGKDRVGQAAEGKVQYVNPHLSAIRDGSSPRKEGATALVYCTAGHLRRVFFDLIKYGMSLPGGFRKANLAFCDILVLDEAHNGSLDYDIIMYLYIKAASEGATMPRLVLASATLTMAMTPFPQAPTHEIKVTGFPVTIEYATKDYRPDDRDLYPDVGRKVLANHKALPVEAGDRGSTWMVFCPGLAEIESVAKILREAKDPALLVTLAHSTITSEESDKMFEPTPKAMRRVIVATNIAEMSLTVDNLSYIYDTMTEKIGETSMSGGFRLSLYSISKASARQRAGRTGRTTAGNVYRMCTEQFFLRLPEQRPNEISRVPLHSMVIETMDAGLDPISVYRGALTPVRLQKTAEVLRLLNMVTSPPAPLAVTESGRFAPKFPLSVRGSSVLWHWLQTGKPLFPVVSVVALIDCYGPSYFYYPKKTEGQKLPDYQVVLDTHYNQYFAIYDDTSDLAILLKMWLTMMDTLQTLTPTPRALKTYNNEASLNNKKIVEVFNIIRQVTTSLAKMGHKMEMGMFSIPAVLEVLVPILKVVYDDQVFTRQGRAAADTLYINKAGNAVYRLDTRNMLTTTPTTSREIVALLTSEIQTRRQGAPSRFISLYQPLPDLKTAGGEKPFPSPEDLLPETPESLARVIRAPGKKSPPAAPKKPPAPKKSAKRAPVMKKMVGLPLPGEGLATSFSGTASPPTLLPPTLPITGLPLPGDEPAGTDVLPPTLPITGLPLPGDEAPITGLPLPGDEPAAPTPLPITRLPLPDESPPPLPSEGLLLPDVKPTALSSDILPDFDVN